MTMATGLSILPAVARAPRATTPVTIYSRWWSRRGHSIRRVLERAGVSYEFVDVGLHPKARSLCLAVAAGRVGFPIVCIEGEWLAQPTREQLEDSLRRHRLC